MVWAFCSQSSRPDSSQNFSLALASDDLLSADTLDSKQIKCRTAGYIRQRMKMSCFRRVKPIRQMVDVFFLPSLHGWDSLRPAMAAETAQTDNPEAAARTLRRKDIRDFSGFSNQARDERSSNLVYVSVWAFNILDLIYKRRYE